ncbi:DUF2274 domain-containing protein [Agrobacterium vitis]|uniref:DUF2274 domain-containing protein n=1 Tax=Agrobacterium vitis TaxID=373 RepID=A0A7K1RGM5_AGRVI|nr:DUF2274 domain-containing protein [Agrobacterium vitis]MCM2467310.1 DUF2274 domain-containing protein [Agrobacterium vitis]MUO68785.1 DUF2274 domain-containing protein [Agrobacterium vitis]MUO79800.1 DUF2274 domain-containing protein [Agrobacterium vitis]MUO93711.1 DUF2274 domain-containing protein [Agrobacterium vitis]
MHALTRESGNAELLNRQQAQSSADPAKLIVPMLERFIATDRGFVKKPTTQGVTNLQPRMPKVDE